MSWSFKQRSLLLLEFGGRLGLRCVNFRWASCLTLWRQAIARLIWFAYHLRGRSWGSGATALILAALMRWEHLSWSYACPCHRLLGGWWYVLTLLAIGRAQWFSCLWLLGRFAWWGFMLLQGDGSLTYCVRFNFLWSWICFTSAINDIRIEKMKNQT